jgi:hypothetical protein
MPSTADILVKKNNAGKAVFAVFVLSFRSAAKYS